MGSGTRGTSEPGIDGRSEHLSLDDLVEDPNRANTLPPEVASALLLRCAVAQSALIGRLLAAPTGSPNGIKDAHDDHLLDVEEAARRLGTSQDYLYRNAKKLPFTVRIGSRLRFSARGIDRFIRARQGR
jgi:excisionase family DNA binding protein